MDRVVIATGGTAGHVVPAIAVADALSEAGAEVSFIGTAERAEAELVPAAGYEIDFLRVRGLDRRNPLKALAAAGRATLAVGAARRILRDRAATAVMGGGGYVAGPAGAAALSMRLPLVLTEADSHLGITNRLLAGRAARVCLAFPIEGRTGERYRVTGRPVPPAVLGGERESARRRFGIGPDADCLLVFGGSLGARSINRATVEAFGRSGEDRGFHVLHITGSRDHAEIREALRAEAADYTLLEYEPDLGDALAASDLVLSRSGGSVFELTATHSPAILVPYPHATGRHQHTNARWMQEAGAAEVVEDSELDPERLGELVSSLFSDPERLQVMTRASASLARPEAAAEIASEILEAR